MDTVFCLAEVGEGGIRGVGVAGVGSWPYKGQCPIIIQGAVTCQARDYMSRTRKSVGTVFKVGGGG